MDQGRGDKDMTKVISICLEKGGVGKSTTAQALASIFGDKGKKVLLIDADSQGNTTFSSGAKPTDYLSSILNRMDKGKEPDTAKTIYKCERYDLIAGDEYLAIFEQKQIKHTLLKDAIKSIKNDYDYIFIDTPPNLGNLLKNALLASDYVIIPADARPLSIVGVDSLVEIIKTVQSANKALKILGILLVKYHDRSILNRQMKELLEDKAKSLETKVFNVTIREGIAVPESQAMRMDLVAYAPKSKPCLDYIALADEILERLGDGN